MKRIAGISIAVATMIALAPPAAAQSWDEVIEMFEATMVQMDVGVMQVVRIGVTQWSTPEERNAVLEALQQGGGTAVAEYLRDQSEKGLVKFQNSPAYQMHYAWQIEEDGKRVIIMATERPIREFDFQGDSRSLEKNLSLLKLVLDTGTGKGDGVMVMGADVSINKEGHLDIETPGTQPIRFTSVREKNQKKKNK